MQLSLENMPWAAAWYQGVIHHKQIHTVTLSVMSSNVITSSWIHMARFNYVLGWSQRDHLKYLLIITVLLNYKLALITVGLLFTSFNISACLQSRCSPATLYYMSEGLNSLWYRANNGRKTVNSFFLHTAGLRCPGVSMLSRKDVVQKWLLTITLHNETTIVSNWINGLWDLPLL